MSTDTATHADFTVAWSVLTGWADHLEEGIREGRILRQEIPAAEAEVTSCRRVANACDTIASRTQP